MNILAVIWGILSALAIGEFSELSPWAARKIVRWSVRVRYIDAGRVEARSEELAALVDARPGKLLKLITALCFAAAAVRAWARRVFSNTAVAGLRLTAGGTLVLSTALTLSLALVASLAFYGAPSPSKPGAAVRGQNPPGAGATTGVSAFIAQYFSAINTHNYQKYSRLLSPESQPTAAEFMAGFRLVTDSHVRITGTHHPGAGVLAVTLAFNSRQPVGESPDGSSCTKWKITLFLGRQAGRYLIGPEPAGYHASYRPCVR